MSISVFFWLLYGISVEYLFVSYTPSRWFTWAFCAIVALIGFTYYAYKVVLLEKLSDLQADSAPSAIRSSVRIADWSTFAFVSPVGFLVTTWALLALHTALIGAAVRTGGSVLWYHTEIGVLLYKTAGLYSTLAVVGFLAVMGTTFSAVIDIVSPIQGTETEG